MSKILMIEDDPQIQAVNRNMLTRRGYDVTLAMSLAEARAALETGTHDVIILDVMLPDGSGIDFLKEMRGGGSDTPVLLLTALNTEKDVVRGLSGGGDDYLAKPYNYDVLAARVEALLRRSRQLTKCFMKGALDFDVVAARAYLNGADLRLSAGEFALLLYFAQNEGRAMSANHLYERIWAAQMNKDSQAIRKTISRLRQKLDDSGFTIDFERDEGYRFKVSVN